MDNFVSIASKLLDEKLKKNFDKFSKKFETDI